MARGLVALLDDMAQLLDDVALMTKVAAQKTAGVVGDDVALNAQMLLGMASKREIPIIWEVAKKSLINKAIIIPCALGISAVAPWAITPILMLGGAYLCYEGVEKVAHKLFHHGDDHHEDTVKGADKILHKTPDEIVEHYAAHEKTIIKSAATTDMILSAEIIVIALGSMAAAPLAAQATALGIIGLAMTAGVYGAAACVVKIDDLGLWLAARDGESKMKQATRALGRGIVNAAPYMMKTLSFVGTAAMFLVGGEILMHGIPGAEALVHHVAHAAHVLPYVGGIAEGIIPVADAMVGGVGAGLIALGVMNPVMKGVTALRRKFFRGQHEKATGDIESPGQDKKPAPEATVKPAQSLAQSKSINTARDALNDAAKPDIETSDMETPVVPDEPNSHKPEIRPQPPGPV